MQLISEKIIVSLCTLSCLLLLVFPLVVFFVCAVYRIFPVLPTKIAEAGTKGDMSCLDAPDA